MHLYDAIETCVSTRRIHTDSMGAYMDLFGGEKDEIKNVALFYSNRRLDAPFDAELVLPMQGDILVGFWVSNPQRVGCILSISRVDGYAEDLEVKPTDRFVYARPSPLRTENDTGKSKKRVIPLWGCDLYPPFVLRVRDAGAAPVSFVPVFACVSTDLKNALEEEKEAKGRNDGEKNIAFATALFNV